MQKMLLIIGKENKRQKPATNMRFGEMAAVLPLERQCEFASVYPAQAFVNPRLPPSRWDVKRIWRTAQP